jgi:hypothetical protein
MPQPPECAPVSYPPTLSIDEAAQVLGYRGRRTLYRLVQDGTLVPLPHPKKPFHFSTQKVLAVRDGKPARKFQD